MTDYKLKYIAAKRELNIYKHFVSQLIKHLKMMQEQTKK